MKKVLVTGSCGFIFSNFIRKVLVENTEYEFVSVDKLISPNNFRNILKNHPLHIGDVADVQFMDMVFRLEEPDIVIHGAAESFVDDSIKHAMPFVHSNVLGTQVMVDMAIKHGVEKFLYVSTDEVYGQLKSKEESSWTETSPLNPRNPYSASKAAGELIVRAAHETHDLNYIVTRCCNNYGPRQPPRNLIPKIITCIMKNEKIPIHGRGKQFREWLFVEDHVTAIMKLINSDIINDTYNIGSGMELTNLEMVDKICNAMGKGKHLISFVKDRPGHDFRYSIDCSKLKNLGWNNQLNFETGIEKCIKWYLDNPWYFDINSDNNHWIHD